MFFSACERDELQPNDESLNLQFTDIENVRVVNGELHFTNPETYFDDVKKILKMNEIELNEWETSIGFRSLRSVINEAHDAAGELTSIDQISDWKEKYKDVVKIQDSTVTDIIDHPFYQTIANRSGEYMIGDAYAKVFPDKIIMIKDGDRSRLAEAREMERSDSDKGILIIDNASKYKIQTRSSCGNGHTHQGVSEKDKRRAYLVLHTKKESSGGISGTQVVMHQYGMKKGVFWRKYNTQHEAQYVNFKVYDNNNNLISLLSDYSNLILAEVKYFYTYFDFNDLTLDKYYTITPKFESAKGRSTTRGTDRRWATICCGYSLSYCPETVGDSYFTW